MKVLIATKNAGKIEGAKRAFETYFNDIEIEGIKVESNVSEEPVNEEMLVKDIIDTDLSKVMDIVFSKDRERHNKGGAIQDLTHGEISRIDLTKEAFIMALTKYINVWR